MNQTPPFVAITDEQIAKLAEVVRSLDRTHRIGKDRFQQALGHQGFKSGLAELIKRLAPAVSSGTGVRAATRLEMLLACQAAGIRLNGSLCEANWDPDNDPKVEIRRVLTPNQVNKVFARFGEGLPWGGTMAQQGEVGRLFSVPETLETLRRYQAERGDLPLPGVWWTLRCNDPYGSDRSLDVYWYPGHGLRVGHICVLSSYPYIGAFFEE